MGLRKKDFEFGDGGDGGDNIDAGGGWNPGDVGPGFPDPRGDNIDAGGGYNPITGQPGAGGTGDGMGNFTLGGSSGLSGLLRMLGLGNGQGGSLSPTDMLTLLSSLGALGGGILSHNATNRATDQMTGAVNKANDAITALLGGQQAIYRPYITTGQNAAAALPGAVFKPIAGNFKPLPNTQGMTLANIMRR